ncbi:MAG TPA: glucuronate isomerase, partial [Thermodesulfobacteriota bacterium]|nr:glucuronate isomerase [Thermodesulfobacteriota bacterium]
ATRRAFRKNAMLPQSILKRIGARAICTTDDPADDLEFHCRADEMTGILFIPTFRPDAYINVAGKSWPDQVDRICRKTANPATLKGLLWALEERHGYFSSKGCRASDHGLLEPYGLEVSQSRAQKIFDEAYGRKKQISLRSPEVREFSSFFMHQFCRMNREKRMVTQIHYGPLRNANEYLFANWGADVGGDIALEHVDVVENIVPLLSIFFSGRDEGEAPLVLYAMNQNYAHVNIALERAFPNVHAGFPWWQNDTPYVMEDYLLHTAGASLLTGSGGPVCDGRKILSEGSRFEVFDRVICRALGKLTADGQISKTGAVRLAKSLMAENQSRLFRIDENR